MMQPGDWDNALRAAAQQPRSSGSQVVMEFTNPSSSSISRLAEAASSSSRKFQVRVVENPFSATRSLPPWIDTDKLQRLEERLVEVARATQKATRGGFRDQLWAGLRRALPHNHTNSTKPPPSAVLLLEVLRRLGEWASKRCIPGSEEELLATSPQSVRASVQLLSFLIRHGLVLQCVEKKEELRAGSSGDRPFFIVFTRLPEVEAEERAKKAEEEMVKAKRTLLDLGIKTPAWLLLPGAWANVEAKREEESPEMENVEAKRPLKRMKTIKEDGSLTPMTLSSMLPVADFGACTMAG